MDTRSGRIPTLDLDTVMTAPNDTCPPSSDLKLQCCCGRPECIYLENNNTLLGGIERDLETAARLGQVRGHREDDELLVTYILLSANLCLSLGRCNCVL